MVHDGDLVIGRSANEFLLGIGTAILFCAGFAAWSLAAFRADGASTMLALGVASVGLFLAGYFLFDRLRDSFAEEV